MVAEATSPLWIGEILMPDALAPNLLRSRLLTLVAALMWSTSGLFAKAPLFDDWPESATGPMLAFWRAAFAALLLVPLVRKPRWSVWLVPMTLCFTLMCIAYMTAMVRTTAANAIWLQATSPWWVLLLTVTLLREPVVRRDLIPLVFGLLGVGTILVFVLGIHNQDRSGVLWGLTAGLTYACVVTMTRRLRGHDAAWLVGLNHLVAVLVMLPWILSLGIWPSA